MNREDIENQISEKLDDLSNDTFMEVIEGFVTSNTEIVDSLGGLGSCSDDHIQSIAETLDIDTEEDLPEEE